MTPSRKERKRARSSPTPPQDDDHSDDDIPRHSDDPSMRPAQAERKRELERNRRNLVNIRFAELEAELRRSLPRVNSVGNAPRPDPAPAKVKRIDKEAVLKEAAQRIAVQQKELSSLFDRISNMTTEIDNLRAEKAELRSDKAYLRSELDTSRGDVQRLRADNIKLWQVVKKQSSIKNLLAPDVAKLPAELFLRPKNNQEQSNLPTSAPLLQPPQVETPVQPPMQRQPSALHTSSNHQSTSDETPNTLHQSPRNQSDAFLVYQSAEELGELFSNYVPGIISHNERIPTPVAVATHSENHPHNPNISSALQTPLLQSVPTSSAPSAFEIQQSQSHFPSKPPDASLQHISSSGDPNHSSRAEKQEEDPFSDIAYCV